MEFVWNFEGFFGFLKKILRNCLEFVWNFKGFLGFLKKILRNFWKSFWSIFLEEIFGWNFLGEIFWEDFFGRIFLGGIFFGRFFGEVFFVCIGIDWFVKILSQCRRRKEGKFQSLEVREQAPSHFKNIVRNCKI